MGPRSKARVQGPRHAVALTASREHAGSGSKAFPRVSFLHSAVLQAVRGEAAVGLTAAFCGLGPGHFVLGLPALSQRLQEQRDGGEQIAEPGQVE